MMMTSLKTYLALYCARSIISLLILFAFKSAHAALQHEGLWFGVNNQEHFANHYQWVYLEHAQVRLMNIVHPVQALLVENNVGYTFNPQQHLWLGYLFVDTDVTHKEAVEHHLVEQFSWKLVDGVDKRLSSRSRFEQVVYTNQSQNLVLFRQLWAYEIVALYAGRVNPLVYDELFFHLNNPRYESEHFLSQNRAFIGANVYPSEQSYWRVGYLNQYISGHHQRKPEMNHLLSLTYVFGDIRIGLPFDS